MPKIKNSYQLTPSGVHWLLFTVILLQVFCTIVYGILYSFFSFERPDGYLLRLCLQIFAVLLPAALYLYPKNIDVTETFLIHHLDLKNVLILAGMGICIQYVCRMINTVTMLVLEWCGAETLSSVLAVPKNVGSFLLALLALVLIPAITEELLMRGVVLHAYLWRGSKSAVIASAFLFAIVHLDVRNLVSTFLLGMILAFVVLQTGSIWAGMILHGVNNLLVLISFMIEQNMSGLWIEIIMIVLFLASLFCFFWLLRVFKEHNRENGARVDIPMKKSVAYDLGRIVFSLPGLLILICFVLFQVFLFNGV
ncbi:MAG: CPBP family intramembrane metalloprotease [Ruminococcaceae bacterium]|nr:CPBP family intramembrane metalloprotease [Oscillospiraceae bacterium]